MTQKGREKGKEDDANLGFDKREDDGAVARDADRGRFRVLRGVGIIVLPHKRTVFH